MLCRRNKEGKCLWLFGHWETWRRKWILNWSRLHFPSLSHAVTFLQRSTSGYSVHYGRTPQMWRATPSHTKETYSTASLAAPRSFSRRLSIPECHAVFQATCRAWRAGLRVCRSEQGAKTQQYGLTAWWVAACNGRLNLKETLDYKSRGKENHVIK